MNPDDYLAALAQARLDYQRAKDRLLEAQDRLKAVDREVALLRRVIENLEPLTAPDGPEEAR